MHDPEHGSGHRPHDEHGNPPDLDAYIQRLEGADREAWQQPDAVVAALQVAPGDTVADVGAGPGYFALRLARAVGPLGRVYAVDVVPAMIAALRERLARVGLGNVTPVLGRRDDPLLPAAALDRVLVSNTFHHFPDGVAYLRLLASTLKAGGRIANLDFHRRDMPVGPPLHHKVAREDFLAIARQAGLVVAEEHTFLEYQYLVVLEPA